MPSQNPRVRQTDLILQELEGELLIYDSLVAKAFCLNSTSAAIWQLCDGQHSELEISIQLSLPEEAVSLAVEDFQANGLLTDYAGTSRRQLLKAGLASLITLPAIAAVSIPSPAAAASMRGLTAFCSSNAQCISGNCDTNITPRRCCVPGSTGIPPGSNFCCADVASCNLVCCSGVGTNIIPFNSCQLGLGLPFRVTCT